jgi:hypothetical protein
MNTSLVFSAVVGPIMMGSCFLIYGFNKELRQKRPFSDKPIIRSKRADNIVRIACLCLGVMGIGMGILMLLLLIKESP